jgi:hypothetical protein
MNVFKDKAGLHARVIAQDALLRMGIIAHLHDGYSTLKMLLGANHQRMLSDSVMTAEQIKICEALGGPHGWAIYKMLLARMDNGQV